MLPVFCVFVFRVVYQLRAQSVSQSVSAYLISAKKGALFFVRVLCNEEGTFTDLRLSSFFPSARADILLPPCPTTSHYEKDLLVHMCVWGEVVRGETSEWADACM